MITGWDFLVGFEVVVLILVFGGVGFFCVVVPIERSFWYRLASRSSVLILFSSFSVRTMYFSTL